MQFYDAKSEKHIITVNTEAITPLVGDVVAIPNQDTLIVTRVIGRRILFDKEDGAILTLDCGPQFSGYYELLNAEKEPT